MCGNSSCNSGADRRSSGSGERGCVHRRILAGKVRQEVLRYFCPGLVEQLTGITVLESDSTSQQLEMDTISLLCSASVKFGMCGQVSDSGPSLLRPCDAMPVFFFFLSGLRLVPRHLLCWREPNDTGTFHLCIS